MATLIPSRVSLRTPRNEHVKQAPEESSVCEVFTGSIRGADPSPDVRLQRHTLSLQENDTYKDTEVS